MDLLHLEKLTVTFDTVDGTVSALRGVALHVAVGERVAVVGESGSGKSVTARAIMGLLPARRTHITGAITFDGTDLLRERPSRLRSQRGRAITMIFQDPTATLNPVFTIRSQFRAVVRRGAPLSASDTEARMRDALREVAVADPARILDSYPFQLSGGLNQRVMIAMALVNRPQLVIADEPGTALDVTVQEQTLRTMRALSETHGTAILFISHNLGVVRHFADRVSVMYAGAIVEEAPTHALFAHPAHPYTRALLASVPRLAGHSLPKPIEGAVPDLRQAIIGCPFLPRCPLATAACAGPVPMVDVGPGHRAACLRVSEPRR